MSPSLSQFQFYRGINIQAGHIYGLQTNKLTQRDPSELKKNQTVTGQIGMESTAR